MTKRAFRVIRVIRPAGIAVAVIVALGLATFDAPVTVWRTGELPVKALTYLPSQSIAQSPQRIWIDTDAACGVNDRTDPDDCFAILALASQKEETKHRRHFYGIRQRRFAYH